MKKESISEKLSGRCPDIENRLPEYIEGKKERNLKIKRCSFDKDDENDLCSVDCEFESE